MRDTFMTGSSLTWTKTSAEKEWLKPLVLMSSSSSLTTMMLMVLIRWSQPDRDHPSLQAPFPHTFFGDFTAESDHDKALWTWPRRWQQRISPVKIITVALCHHSARGAEPARSFPFQARASTLPLSSVAYLKTTDTMLPLLGSQNRHEHDRGVNSGVFSFPEQQTRGFSPRVYGYVDRQTGAFVLICMLCVSVCSGVVTESWVRH